MGGSGPLPVQAQAGLYTCKAARSTLCPVTQRTPPQPGAAAVQSGAPTPVTAAVAAVAFVGDVAARAAGTEGAAFAGPAGKVVDDLIAAAGLRRDEVLLTGLLPAPLPGNRDASPGELAAGLAALTAVLTAAQVRVVCTLGNGATRAVRRNGAPVSALHGRPELAELGGRAVHLLPLHHPASALYTPGVLETMHRDVAAIAGLLATPLPEPEPAEEVSSAEPATQAASETKQPQAHPGPEPADELRLF